MSVECSSLVIRRTARWSATAAAIRCCVLHKLRAHGCKTRCACGRHDAPEVKSFISGIVLGIRHETPEDIEEPFQQTGTIHLFAVAGLHVGIVAALLWVLAAIARLPRKRAAAFIIPSLFFLCCGNGAAHPGPTRCCDGFDPRRQLLFRTTSISAKQPRGSGVFHSVLEHE